MSIFRASILTLTFVLPQAALAQPATGNVNDCTQLQDPIALRNCILRFEGVRTPVPQTIESPPPAATAPEATPDASDGGITEVPPTPRPRGSASRKPPAARVASPQPAAPAQAVTSGSAAAQSGAATPALPRPNPKDTLVHIEQIDVPRARR